MTFDRLAYRSSLSPYRIRLLIRGGSRGIASEPVAGLHSPLWLLVGMTAMAYAPEDVVRPASASGSEAAELRSRQNATRPRLGMSRFLAPMRTLGSVPCRTFSRRKSRPRPVMATASEIDTRRGNSSTSHIGLAQSGVGRGIEESVQGGSQGSG